MFSQIIFGMPKNCTNRKCRHPFYRESHLGWLPKNEVEVFVVMRCPKCKDTFKIAQMLSMVHEYKEKLPRDPKMTRPKKNDPPITLAEINKLRKQMEDDPNPLASLYEGHKPGASAPPE